MTEPTFDIHGYPTDEMLDRIAEWKIATTADVEALIKFARKAWHWPDYWCGNKRTHHVSTGGWSANESIIAALRRNYLFWALCWEQSKRGGHYQFAVPIIEETTAGDLEN